MAQSSFLKNFAKCKVLVIGDIMLDKYIWGKVSRISPEAPVQIVLVESESFSPGGAANVASNVAALGASVAIIGIVGQDDSGKRLATELSLRGIRTDYIVEDQSRPTIQKVRIIAHNQQLIRFDYEKYDGLSESVVARLNDAISKAILESDIIVVSDYAKAVIDKRTMDFLFSKSGGKLVVVDPKPKNARLYENASVILPNYAEACSIASFEPKDESELQILGNKLMQMMKSDVVITRGEKGMSIFNRHGSVTHIPTRAKEVYDVTGAGDTATAVMALALASGARLEDAALIANCAAGIVVGKVGTSAVSLTELRKALAE